MSLPEHHLPAITEASSSGPGASPQFEIIHGSEEPFFIPEAAHDATYFAGISRDRVLSPQQKASCIAAALLDNASLHYQSNRLAWPDEHDFAESYDLANYLTATKGNDDTDILIEILDEALQAEEAAPLYAHIIKSAEQIAHLVTVGRPASVAVMMLRLWAVIDAEVELPSLFEKAKNEARKRKIGEAARRGFAH